ncbi:MAG: hypothetical protein WBE76_04880 [Terracidiphilus sp.]
MLEQLQPGWLLTKWQVFFYLLLSRTVMFGALAILVWCGIGIVFFKAKDIVFGLLGLGVFIGAISLIVGLVWALGLFLRTSDRLPGWFQSLFRVMSSLARFMSALARAILVVYLFLLRIVFRIFVWPVQWALARNGRTLNDDIQPVERLSWSWVKFFKGFAFLTINPRHRDSSLLNVLFSFIFWSCRILWFALLAVFTIGSIQDLPQQKTDHAEDFLSVLAFTLPNLFCAFFSAIRGNAVELKTAPNLGILLSGRNALIAAAINFALDFIAKFIFLKWQPDLLIGSPFTLLATAVIIAGALAWGRLGGLDFLAHYCLRFVLRRCGYIPRDYVRFLNYAASELGFLQKVGGGYVFMHRYLLEYFASSEQSSSGAANFSAEVHAMPN